MGVDHLIVDANGLINNVDLRKKSSKLYTVPDVIAEVKDLQARMSISLVDLNVMYPDERSVTQVVDFSKATGDFSALSRADIQVLALAHMIYVREDNESSLNSAPKIVEVIDQVEQKAKRCDDSGWTVVEKFKPAKSAHKHFEDTQREEELNSKVACLTTDYAMQNVLLQMGIPIVSGTGMRIRHARSWVLRCHACFEITRDQTKLFCPSCGNNTLLRASASVQEDGTLKIYLKKGFQYRLRGTIYPIPSSKTGKNAKNLILRADQRELELAKRSRIKIKPLALSEQQEYLPEMKIPAKVIIGYGNRNVNEVSRTNPARAR